jgi:predicted nucleic acid-binding protein
MNSPVCIDVSVLIKLVVEEAGSDLVDRRWEEWIVRGVQVAATTLIRYEVAEVLREKARRGQLSQALARSALAAALNMEGIELVDSADLHLCAWDLVGKLGLRSYYDAAYLALAEIRNCELWTANRRLYRSVKDKVGYVRLTLS